MSTGQTIVFWTLIAVTLLGCLAVISQVGKPRKPTSAAIANITLVGNLLFILGLWYVVQR